MERTIGNIGIWRCRDCYYKQSLLLLLMSLSQNFDHLRFGASSVSESPQLLETMRYSSFKQWIFKGARSCNGKQTCYIYDLYCCLQVPTFFCTGFGGCGESTIKLLLKIHQTLGNLQRTRISFVSLRNSRLHLQNKPPF